MAAQSHTHTSPPTLTPKRSTFEAWKADGYPLIPRKWTDNSFLPVPDSAVPPPGMIGALSLTQRRTSSLFLQVLFKHCFSGDHSRRFRPHAPDVTTCECSYPLDFQDQLTELPVVPTLVTDPVATSVLSPSMPTLVGEDVKDRSAPPRQAWWVAPIAALLRSDDTPSPPLTPTPSPALPRPGPVRRPVPRYLLLPPDLCASCLYSRTEPLSPLHISHGQG